MAVDLQPGGDSWDQSNQLRCVSVDSRLLDQAAEREENYEESATENDKISR